jgi:hypothetical protein
MGTQLAGTLRPGEKCDPDSLSHPPVIRILMARCDMPLPKLPAHGLFIRYGKFEAAAYGRWAVMGLVSLIAIGGACALRYLGLL